MMVDVDYQVDADFQEDDELKKDEFSHFTNTQNVEEISEEEDENEEMTTLPQTVSNTEKKCDIQSKKSIIPMTCVSDKMKRWYIGALLLILSILLFADQQLVAPSLHRIGEYLNLSDDAEDPWSNIDFVLGGMLPLFFFALGTPITLFIGPIIDRSHRRNLFVLLVFCAEIPCFLTYFATETWELLLFRALTGIAMAGAEPLIYSIMSDMFGPKERSVMASVISIGAGIGLLAGQSLAGYMDPMVLDSWKIPFLIVSLPSMAFASVTLFIVEEPDRGAREEAVDNAKENGGNATYDGTLSGAKLCSIMKVGTNICLFCAELPNAMGWGVLFAYLTDFIAVDKGFGSSGATTAVTLFGVGLAVGALSGGFLGQVLFNRCKHFSGAVPSAVAFSCLFGALPFYWAIDADYTCIVDYETCNASVNITEGESFEDFTAECVSFGYIECSAETWATMVVVMITSGILLGVPNANVRAMLLNVNLPEVRGSTMTLLVVVSSLGKGLGPLLAATMIQELGRNAAFNIAVGFFAISCVPYFACICQLGKDIRRQAMAVEAIVKVEKKQKKSRKKSSTKKGITAASDVRLEMSPTENKIYSNGGSTTVPIYSNRARRKKNISAVMSDGDTDKKESPDNTENDNHVLTASNAKHIEQEQVDDKREHNVFQVM